MKLKQLPFVPDFFELIVDQKFTRTFHGNIETIVTDVLNDEIIETKKYFFEKPTTYRVPNDELGIENSVLEEVGFSFEIETDGESQFELLKGKNFFCFVGKNETSYRFKITIDNVEIPAHSNRFGYCVYFDKNFSVSLPIVRDINNALVFSNADFIVFKDKDGIKAITEWPQTITPYLHLSNLNVLFVDIFKLSPSYKEKSFLIDFKKREVVYSVFEDNIKLHIGGNEIELFNNDVLLFNDSTFLFDKKMVDNPTFSEIYKIKGVHVPLYFEEKKNGLLISKTNHCYEFQFTVVVYENREVENGSVTVVVKSNKKQFFIHDSLGEKFIESQLTEITEDKVVHIPHSFTLLDILSVVSRRPRKEYIFLSKVKARGSKERGSVKYVQSVNAKDVVVVNNKIYMNVHEIVSEPTKLRIYAVSPFFVF